ncbi:MAG: hypothetical protein U1E60_13730 [Reyranellaceae bacterium]
MSRRALIATWLTLAVVIVIQALPFTYGYRRAADDTVFLDALAGGWAGIEWLTLRLSMIQGRLGLLVAIPLNVLGTYLADNYWLRLAYVLMHFGVFFLFAAYVSRLLAANVTYPLLVLLLTLQAIGGVNDYMPPITYPVQNTLPLILLFGARLAILRADGQKRTGGFAVWLARLAFLIALVVTEYTFLVGSAALACEYAAKWTRGLRRDPGRAKFSVLIDRGFLWDAGLVAIALISYLGYRAVFPSTYEGNVIDGAGSPWRILATMARHVHAGTIFVRDLFDIASLPRQALLLSAVVGVVTAVCSSLVLSQARSIRAPFVVMAACIAAIAYVTFPLAGNARQQLWCLESGACGYLDSRITYLGFGLIVLCFIGLVLKWMPTPRAVGAMVAVLSGALGLLGAANYAFNLRDGLAYANDAKGWHRANLLACYPDMQPELDRRLIRMIDPEARIRFHPGTDQAHFWRRYLALKSRNQLCTEDGERQQADRRLLSDAEPILSIDHTILFSQLMSARYLGKGWSALEPAGVWTDGQRADLAFALAPGAEGKPLALKLRFTVYVRPSLPGQTIDILVDGKRVDTWTITRAMNEGGVQERTIPLGLGRGPREETEVVLHILDPRQPLADRDIADTRHLGIFLHSMTLTESADKTR